MKRGFIRCLWGDFKWTDPHVINSEIYMEIHNTLKNQYLHPFMTFVWGEDNFSFLESLGVDCELVHKKSIQWENEDHHFRHKLESYRIALEDKGFDEIVHLDWDTIPTRLMDSNFWNILEQRESIQACLYRLNHTTCLWRDNGPAKRQVTNANFIYFRDKSFPSRIIDIWDNFPDERKYKFNDEIAISYFIDELNQKWIGASEYHNRYEPMVADMKRFSIFKNKNKHELYKNYFRHS